VTEAPQVASALETSPLAIADLTDQIWKSNAVTTLIGFPLWLEASTILANALNTAWSGTVSPSDALAGAQTSLEKMGPLSF
jgi:hypothetical protein